MNILDYLIGNTDRHWGNWGMLIDNKTNQPIRLYDLMDFNKAFHAYDQVEGANCLTTETTQREMFYRRLELLTGYENSEKNNSGTVFC